MSSARIWSVLLFLATVALLHLGCSDAEVGSTASGANNNAAGQKNGGAGVQAGNSAGNVSPESPGSGGSESAGSSGVESAGAGGMSLGDAGMSMMSGDAGASGPSPSAGCGMPAGQALNSWVEQPTLMVNGKSRQWWIWLPTNYNPARAYPVVFTFHGCGGASNFLPMQKVTGEEAIVVRGTGIDPMGCWTYSATGEDVSFFDAMLAGVEAKSCVDSSRVFLTGYSSGSWFTNTLECVRGDKLRATGTVSGGVAVRGTTCKGKYARIFVHDANDTTNYFIRNGDTTRDGNYVERARLIALNHCATDTPPPVPEDPAPCARYQNCDPGYPVIMCQTMGKGHDRQDTLATTAFWGLFHSL